MSYLRLVSAVMQRRANPTLHSMTSSVLDSLCCCRDLYVGAVLDVHMAWFELQEADEFTLQYMESNRHAYPQADVNNAVATIRDGIAGADFCSSDVLWGCLHSVRGTCQQDVTRDEQELLRRCSVVSW